MTSHGGSEKPTNQDHLTLEAWSQGLMVGALIVMAMITAANMRAGVLLHKLVLLELVLAVPNGFFIFLNPPVFGWYLSSTAAILIASWSLHNVIAWLKSKPFLSRTTSRIYIGTVISVQAYWIVEIYANFTYFNDINERLFVATRPYEALCRYNFPSHRMHCQMKLTFIRSSDPWWIFTTVNLLWNIKTRYNFGYIELIRVSPRFSILLLSMCLSVAFIVVDILSVTSVLKTGSINPFWKFSFVFKCFTDTIVLDDFKTALDRLWKHQKSQLVGVVCVNTKFEPAFEQLEFQSSGDPRRTSSQDPLEGNASNSV